MSTETTDLSAALSQLTTDIADIIKGYQAMEERADDELRTIAQRMHALHEAHAAALLATIEEMGGRPEDTASVMGAVRQAVATGRDWFGALDASMIPQIVAGEEWLIASYDTAIAAATPETDIHTMLDDQRSAIRAHIDPLKRS